MEYLNSIIIVYIWSNHLFSLHISLGTWVMVFHISFLDVHGSPFLTCQFVIGPRKPKGLSRDQDLQRHSAEFSILIFRTTGRLYWTLSNIVVCVLDTKPHSGMCLCCVCPFPCNHDLLDSRSAS